MLHLGHRHGQLMVTEAVSRCRDRIEHLIRPLTEPGINQFVVVFRVFIIQMLKHIRDALIGVRNAGILREIRNGLLQHVVFIPDFTDNLFDYVLDGHDTEGSSEVVGHYCHIDPLSGHHRQQLSKLGALMDEERFIQ